MESTKVHNLSDYIQIPIEELIVHKHNIRDLYLVLGNRNPILITSSKENTQDSLLRYKAKGAKYIYVKVDDYVGAFCSPYIDFLEAELTWPITIDSNGVEFAELRTTLYKVLNELHSLAAPNPPHRLGHFLTVFAFIKLYQDTESRKLLLILKDKSLSTFATRCATALTAVILAHHNEIYERDTLLTIAQAGFLGIIDEANHSSIYKNSSPNSLIMIVAHEFARLTLKNMTNNFPRSPAQAIYEIMQHSNDVRSIKLANSLSEIYKYSYF